MTNPIIYIVIPALNAGKYVKALSNALNSQTLVIKSLIVVDSGSTDGSQLEWNYSTTMVEHIKKSDFRHGDTRNRGARLGANAEILVFMTQDAVPNSLDWLQRLVEPIQLGEAVATFARQLPRSDASMLEEFSRYFNYSAHSSTRTHKDIPKLGVKAFFFSNVSSAIRADIFWSLGGFPSEVIMNEDMMLAAKILRAGHSIKYVAESEVIHSHGYTLKQQFRRNFDVGAFFADAGSVLEGAAVSGEGLRFVRAQMRHVLSHGRPDLLALVVAEAMTKFTAFQLGKRHHLLPVGLKRRMSMHSYHWDRKKE